MLSATKERETNPKSKAGGTSWLTTWTLLLATGLFGGHRFALGKRLSGLAQCSLTIASFGLFFRHRFAPNLTHLFAAWSLFGLVFVWTVTDLLAHWWGGLYDTQGQRLYPRPNDKRIAWRGIRWLALFFVLQGISHLIAFHHASPFQMEFPALLQTKASSNAGLLLLSLLLAWSVAAWLGLYVATERTKAWQARAAWNTLIPLGLVSLVALLHGWLLLASLKPFRVSRAPSTLGVSFPWDARSLLARIIHDAYYPVASALWMSSLGLLLVLYTLTRSPNCLSWRARIASVPIFILPLGLFAGLGWLGFGHQNPVLYFGEALNLLSWPPNAYRLQWFAGLLCLAFLLRLVTQPDTSASTGSYTVQERVLLAPLIALFIVLLAGWINQTMIITNWFSVLRPGVCLGATAAPGNSKQIAHLVQQTLALQEVWKVTWLSGFFVALVGSWLYWKRADALLPALRAHWRGIVTLLVVGALLATGLTTLQANARSTLFEKFAPFQKRHRGFFLQDIPKDAAFLSLARPNKKIKTTTTLHDVMRLTKESEGATALFGTVLITERNHILTFMGQKLGRIGQTQSPAPHKSADKASSKRDVYGKLRHRLSAYARERKKGFFAVFAREYIPLPSIFAARTRMQDVARILRWSYEEGFRDFRFLFPTQQQARLRSGNTWLHTDAKQLRFSLLPTQAAATHKPGTKAKKTDRPVPGATQLRLTTQSIAFPGVRRQRAFTRTTPNAALRAFLRKAPKTKAEREWIVSYSRDLPYYRLLQVLYLLHTHHKTRARVWLHVP